MGEKEPLLFEFRIMVSSSRGQWLEGVERCFMGADDILHLDLDDEGG
jgi:hypothetical protein